MAERTDEERVSAVESMFRIRAVESPPDERGARTIWHRGLKGAELVSEVDSSGRVTRQEFALFDDVIQWTGELKTGRSSAAIGSKGATASGQLEWDTTLVSDRVDRVGRALKRYKGNDRFILHVRDVLGVGEEDGPALIDAPITRSAPAIRDEVAAAEESQRELERSARRRERIGLIGIAIGVTALLLSLVVLWRSMAS